MRIPAAVRTAQGWYRRRIERRLERAVGGVARLRVVVLLAGVLSLTSADMAAVGAMATQLESSLRIGNTDIGLLVTVSSGIGVVTTLPFGALADRVRRVDVLVVSIVVWSAAMIACAAAVSFEMLLLFRLALGAAIAAGGPLVASLTGDLFAPAERGRIYGFILAGELVGAGFGVLICGDLAAVWSWRASFVLLAIAGLGLAWAIRRRLPEPARGGQSRLPVGAERIRPAEEVSDTPDRTGDTDEPAQSRETRLTREVRREEISPHQDLVLRDDPRGRSLRWAVRYVLSVRTNVVLIIASALGYFFFSGLRTFAIPFAKARFGLGQGVASLLLLLIGAGSLLGILLAGRISDGLIARHHVTVRPVAAGVCFTVAAALFIPGLLTTSLLIAIPLLFVAAAGIGGANPPLDAARLDIMPALLWGRAEGVRTVLRKVLEAAAPLLFGYVSTLLGGAAGGGYGHPVGTQPHGAAGLDHTFLLMLAPLLAAAVLLLVVARRTYPGDVATAIASEQATRAPVPDNPTRGGSP